MTDDTIKTDIAAPTSAATPAMSVPSGFLPLLIAMSGLGPMSMQAIMPALPALAVHFNEDIAVAQLTISLYLVGLAFSQLIVGPLSDKFGRRPVILAGLLLMVLSNVGGSMAVSLQQVIAARIVQALGAAAGLAVGRAMIRDLYERDRAASMIGIVVGSMMIAPMIGPFFGGVLETTYGWRTIFWFLGGVSLAVFLWAWATLPETRRVRTGPDASGFFRDVRALIGTPAISWLRHCAGARRRHLLHLRLRRRLRHHHADGPLQRRVRRLVRARRDRLHGRQPDVRAADAVGRRPPHDLDRPVDCRSQAR